MSTAQTQAQPYTTEPVEACWIACNDCGENELIEADLRNHA